MDRTLGITALLIILANLVLISENLINVYFDAYKITVLKKSVRHGINFGMYALVTGLCIWIFQMDIWFAVAYAISAFFNRQITFDIPLNLRRHLSWDYVSLDRPPKALMDRIEIRIFGYNGKLPVVVYALLWVVTLTIQFLL
jgi:hypothetical protein